VAWRAPLLWTILALLVLVACLFLYSPVGEVGRLLLPADLARDLGTPPGWIGRMGFVLLFPLVLGGFAARMGSHAVAGEIASGTLGLLLAQPVSRRAFLFAKSLALLICLILLTLVIGLGLLAGNWIFGVGLNLALFPAALLALLLYSLLVGFLALALGCLGISRRLSLAMAWLLILLWLGLALLVYLPTAWSGWPFLSPLYALSMQNPLTAGVPALAVALLGALAGMAFLSSWLIFEFRDLEI